jgi:hypothetical protein
LGGPLFRVQALPQGASNRCQRLLLLLTTGIGKPHVQRCFRAMLDCNYHCLTDKKEPVAGYPCMLTACTARVSIALKALFKSAKMMCVCRPCAVGLWGST